MHLRLSGIDLVLLKTESKERAYVNTVDTDLSRTFRIPDEKIFYLLNPDCRHCRYNAHPHQTDLSRTFRIPDEKPSVFLNWSSTDVVLLKTESKHQC